MTLKVLVIPEDHTKDQYMLKPIVQAMMKKVGKPRARVRVCGNPRLRGEPQATSWEVIEKIISQYREIDLFLLCVDRDGVDERKAKLDSREQQANEMLGGSKKFLAENAWQEIEVWVLAGHDLPREWSWEDIRSERDPKERFFVPFAEQRGVFQSLGEGRGKLAQEAVRKFDRIYKRCPELADFGTRIQDWLS